MILRGKRDEKTYGTTACHRLLIKRQYYRRLTSRNGNTFDALAERRVKALEIANDLIEREIHTSDKEESL